MMKRTLLIVAILALSVAPAMATVTISAIQNVPTAPGGPYSATRMCNVIDINYVCGASERVRAFAIEVNVDNGFVISRVSDYNTGESATAAPRKLGYGIFPGKFRDVITPTDPCWTDGNYMPIAPNTDTDANGTGLGTHKVILELGSLYVGESNKPAAQGTLCRLYVTPPSVPMDCNIQIALNTTRGGVVLEDGTAATTSLVARGLVSAGKISFPECFPCWQPYDTQYSEFLSTWKSPCWCGQYAKQLNGLPDANWRTQCWGDVDGKYEGPTTKYRVYQSDYTKMLQAWGKKATALRANNNALMCADLDHKFEGPTTKYRVYQSDYTKMLLGWGKKETVLRAPPYGWCPQ